MTRYPDQVNFQDGGEEGSEKDMDTMNEKMRRVRVEVTEFDIMSWTWDLGRRRII